MERKEGIWGDIWGDIKVYACLCLLFSHIHSFVHSFTSFSLSVADLCLKERLIESLHGSTAGNSFKWCIVFSFSPFLSLPIYLSFFKRQDKGIKEGKNGSIKKEKGDFTSCLTTESKHVLSNTPFFVSFSVHVFFFVSKIKWKRIESFETLFVSFQTLQVMASFEEEHFSPSPLYPLPYMFPFPFRRLNKERKEKGK